MEQFLALAKNARGVSAAALVQEIISHPNVFVFEELLHTSAIAELAGTEHSPYFDLLTVFAYGTYTTYKERQACLPALTPEQLRKLRFLTIASLATGCKKIKYADLQQELGITSVRELEDLIILAVYSGVVRGKLDQVHSEFDVEFAIGRDIQPGSLDTMAVTLSKWSSQCQQALESIESCIGQANASRAKHRSEEKAHERAVEIALQQVLPVQVSGNQMDSEYSSSPSSSALESFNNVQPTAKRQKMKGTSSVQRKVV
ncbi:COP9 signalosome complex subunit 7-like [Sycon ciliatum]|uniref:COP9 signalosome complex subunit 7-like n=1 Tax=Sycon ciliatum TaxID=27933 RepID=UPI0031F7153A